MNPNPSMHVLHTRNEHLGSFHCLMFCLKLTRELLFPIFAGSCCHNCGPLYAIDSSPQYTVVGNWLLRFIIFFILYEIFLNLSISFLTGVDRPLRHLKVQLLVAIYFLNECVLSLVRCSTLVRSSYEITLVPLSVRPSLSFHKIVSLVFYIIHDDSWPWYLVTGEARSLKKKLAVWVWAQRA